MSTIRRAALSALVSFALVGCANQKFHQPLKSNVAASLQPVEVKVGIAQPELYAAYEPSGAGAAAAAGCGAIPGLGILLAAACGGAFGAVDASVNASRAKDADAIVRPLKDSLVDLSFDELAQGKLTEALKGVQGMQTASLTVLKKTDNKSYDETFRASTASAVMFVNVDYHLSKDFSTLEVSARSQLYPRSAAARSAAGLPAALAADVSPLNLQGSAYRRDVHYQIKLPASPTSAAYVAAWNADNARLMRNGLTSATTELARLLSEDLQRGETPLKEGTRIKLETGMTADLIAETDAGQLLQYPDSSLRFVAKAPTISTPGAAADVTAAK